MKKFFKEVSVVDGQAAVIVNRNGQYRVVLGGKDGNAISKFILNPVLGEQVSTFIDARGHEQSLVNMRDEHTQRVTVSCESYEGLPLEVAVEVTVRVSDPLLRVVNVGNRFVAALEEVIIESIRASFDLVPCREFLVRMGARPTHLADEDLRVSANSMVRRKELGLRVDLLRIVSIAGVEPRRKRVNRLLRPMWGDLVPKD